MSKITVENIDIELVRKKIKNLHLTVYPPNGRVRLSVPSHMDNEAVKSFVLTKLPWIKKQKTKYTTQELLPAKEFISGEIHPFSDEIYLLNVVETRGKQYVELRNNKFMDMYVRPGSTFEKREKLMTDFYRQKLKEIIPSYIAKWERIMGVRVDEFGVKLMKTRWGTCNIRDKRIWINLELAKKAPRCLDYIIVHEMVHLLEKHHNKSFKEYMSRFLPDWKSIKDELNGLNLDSGKRSY